MELDGEKRLSDADAELRWESVRMARARRRLVEHELTRRRTLLALTVGLAIIGAVMALLGSHYLGGAFTGAAIVPGVATLPRGDSTIARCRITTEARRREDTTAAETSR